MTSICSLAISSASRSRPFTCDPSTGALTLVSGSPFSARNGHTPRRDDNGSERHALYVASPPNLIYVFNIAADGSSEPGDGLTVHHQSGQRRCSRWLHFRGRHAGPGPPPNLNPPPPVTPPPPPVTASANRHTAARTPPPPPSGPMAVKIEIRSGDDDGDDHHGPAEINPKSHGKIRVAILSSSAFNAPAQVDMSSLTFGHSGSEKSLAFCEIQRRDVNHDHLADMVCHFDTQKTNFKRGDTLGILDGMLVDGKTLIQGSDSIRIAR